MTHASRDPIAGLGFDPDALRKKYREERGEAINDAGKDSKK